MITIKAIHDNGKRYPERQLDIEEKQIVIAVWGDDENYIYFTEEDKGSDKWIEYENATKSVMNQEVVNPLIQAFKDATQEEIDEFTLLLKSGKS